MHRGEFGRPRRRWRDDSIGVSLAHVGLPLPTGRRPPQRPDGELAPDVASRDRHVGAPPDQQLPAHLGRTGRRPLDRDLAHGENSIRALANEWTHHLEGEGAGRVVADGEHPHRHPVAIAPFDELGVATLRADDPAVGRAGASLGGQAPRLLDTVDDERGARHDGPRRQRQRVDRLLEREARTVGRGDLELVPAARRRGCLVDAVSHRHARGREGTSPPKSLLEVVVVGREGPPERDLGVGGELRCREEGRRPEDERVVGRLGAGPPPVDRVPAHEVFRVPPVPDGDPPEVIGIGAGEQLDDLRTLLVERELSQVAQVGA